MTMTDTDKPPVIPPVPAPVPAPVTIPVTQAFELPEQLAADDVPPNIGAETDKAPAPICGKDGCGNPVTKPAKGPYPKYCDEHRGTRSSSGTGTKRGSWAKAAVVEESLTRYVHMVGGAVTFIDATDGRTVVKHGPKVAHELVELARDDAKLRRYLEMVATPGKYGPLVMALAGMVLPILANHNLVPQIVIPFLTDDDNPTQGKE